MEDKISYESLTVIRAAIEHELEKMDQAQLRNTGWFTWNVDDVLDEKDYRRKWNQ